MTRWLKRLFRFFLLVFIVGAVGLIWLLSQRDTLIEAGTAIDEQRTIEQAVKGVEIATSRVDVKVMYSHIPTARIGLVGKVSEEQRKQIQLQSEVKADGSLQVKVIEQQGANLFFMGRSWLQLQVLLPETDDSYDRLQVKTDTGDVSIHTVSAKEGKVFSSTGDIDLLGFHGDTLEVKTETGDINLIDTQAAMQLTSTTGDVDVLNVPELLHALKVSTETGDVQITFAKQPAAVDLDLEAPIGDIEVGWTKGSYSVGGPTLSVKSSTGDIRIQ
ncbi:DUF4097 family beta strand repeat-containing protein [Brevibacillus sp. AY1]|uniref:DUF4097 family beta strand repeat-containing protein n=1 Tax=Brevibacillus sp. AY1 TaxID=2807621 RepID=UPI0024573EEB|nr:DUF4097 family beta strand repeat-containing protein [Brevibacillus sp. AY1]MDH4617546.1 DUF4097 family beta strand repeat protein [Brevibacillus sp. AY1]